jgi:hypothetical protein
VRPLLLLLSMLALFGACYEARKLTPADVNTPSHPTSVWVTTSRQLTFKFDSAWVEADLLLGSVNGKAESIPLTEITSLHARPQVSIARTAALVVAGMGVAGIVLYASEHAWGDAVDTMTNAH